MILVTTPDYNPPQAYYNSSYDSPLGATGKTINEAIREVAKKKKAGLLDWNLLMDVGVSKMKKYNVKLMYDDGVHPNIFGNYLLALSVLEYNGLKINTYETVYKEFLKYSPQFKKLFGFSASGQKLRDVLAELYNIVNNLADKHLK